MSGKEASQQRLKKEKRLTEDLFGFNPAETEDRCAEDGHT
jgi:hypothetical protein